jgi:site-specific DNA-methyltransferase (adenine-specific)
MTDAPYISRSKTDSHATPPYILERVRNDFGELSTYDPCPLADDWTVDGLSEPFPHDGVIFVNPPYSRLKTTSKGLGWIEKCHIEAVGGAHVVILIPARTGTSWFHDIILANNHRVIFIRGRIKFVGSASGAPFDSVFIEMRPP